MNIRMRSFLCFLVVVSLVATKASGSEWQTDYKQALAAAKAERKFVLLDFTGSDWCGPCIQMKKVVFSKAAFLDYAKQNLVLVEIDYPRVKTLPEKIKEQNEHLLHQYHIDESGFPTVILLSPDGKALGQLEGYGGQRPADIIAWVEKLRGKSS